MRSNSITTLTLAAAILTGLLLTGRADAQITVTSERVGANYPTNGTFVFPTVPSNSSVDLANGKTFTVLAGAPSPAAGPISVLTNGPAQTNHDSVAESFFTVGNVADGTERMRIQIDLDAVYSIDRISSYSWHQNSRAPQVYKVYGAVSPSNSIPNFTNAPFQDLAALSALGYTEIADVRTAQTSAGQYGVNIAGTIGAYRYLLFDLAPPASSPPRPTFFGEIDIFGTPLGPATFPFTITPATSPATGYDLAWASRPVKVYRLRTSTDLGTAPAEWDVVAENITTTPPENTYNVPQDGPRRFYVVEEETAPPLLAADFEENNGGFTAATTEGSAWDYGAPTSGSVEAPNIGGFVTSGNGGSARCWGTVIGSPGYYAPPTTTRLRSPVIDLSGVAGAYFTFAQALDLEASDTAVVNIINATTDDIIVSAIHTSTDGNLNNAIWSAVPPINLAAAVGQQVRIEWVFNGQIGTDYMGWYIDDVVVTETAP